MWLAEKVQISFKAVKKDITGLKQSLHDWVLHLNSNQKVMEKKIEALETRVRMLETEKKLRTVKLESF